MSAEDVVDQTIERDVAVQEGQMEGDGERPMTKDQEKRCRKVEEILIRHRFFNRVIARLRRCAAVARQRIGDPPCMALVGDTGVGKTTIIEAFLKERRRQETPEGSRIPYLYDLLPARATIKGTAGSLLEALGDPNASRGTLWNMQSRLIDYIRRCKVEMLLLDEIQQLVDKRFGRVLDDVMDFLKVLVKKTRVPLVLIGQRQAAETILHHPAADQLARLVGRPLVLRPFPWDRAHPATIREFRALLRAIDEALPLERSGLDDMERAQRIHVATAGSLGNIMELTRESAHTAIMTGYTRIETVHLAEAYETRLCSDIAGDSKQTRRDAKSATSDPVEINPFTCPFDSLMSVD